ncbi:MAG: ABC transporter ATP-binding protein [Acidimicrobiia bacterium]|nr:ABC transporter ATP-binding protein [bacterium]MXW59195.1 ABC transporter ATP-binding protein [Acidimicrobiia bacterium]MXZ79679.1 ABC transporter ATP-binding protein [Acidimicrobiia bacterium]MXZ85334.1 ABC transporter ATP-binding protein [Acidimicrobiia bacterium]MYB10268.1 ABC transporter ATP-binding protein [Acidimicrobiia bacterium]
MSIQAEIQAATGGFAIQAEFDAPQGSCTAIVGPNGAGKTTLIHALAGLIPLQKGRIVLAGQLVDDATQGVHVPSNRRPIALHSQHNLLFPHLSVVDNVAFGPQCSGLSTRLARQRAEEWLHKVGLADMAELRPAQLSGGQAQRVGLARAAACQPDVLLLDESLASLDAETRTDVRHLLADIPATRVLITHDPVEARVLADQLLVMERGEIVQTGTPEEVTADPRTPWTAGLLDINLLTGQAIGTHVALDCGLALTTATPMTGPVLVTFSPAAVTLSTAEPHTSARNTWQAEVARIQPESDRVRVLLGAPAPCHVWVTPQAANELGLSAGTRCWAALKATELTVREA